MLREGADYKWNSNGILSIHWNQKWDDIVLDGYKPIELIGAGANGVTYKARHEITDRDVAIKVWIPRREQYEEQLFNEVRKLSHLQDRAIVTIHDGKILPNGLCVAVYDYIQGVSLKEWLQNEHSNQERLDICREILRAVHYYQSKNLIHGDLHEGNILISDGCHVTIIDFGTSAFARVGQSRDRENYFVASLGATLLKTCKAYSQTHFAFHIPTRSRINQQRIELLSGELFRFSMEPILMTETMQAYLEMMELLEYVLKLQKEDMVTLASFASKSSYLDINTFKNDVMRTYVEPKWHRNFTDILDANIYEASFPSLIEDTNVMGQIFTSSFISYCELAKRVRPSLVNPIETGDFHVQDDSKDSDIFLYRQLAYELECWISNNGEGNFFKVTPALQKKLGQSIFEIYEMARSILFHSLDRHFGKGMLLFSYWLGTKMREIQRTPSFQCKMDEIMTVDD